MLRRTCIMDKYTLKNVRSKEILKKDVLLQKQEFININYAYGLNGSDLRYVKQ